ncbi:MAG: FG-GAP-like repeat-containing protein [Planctomycetota bacterium]|jgi:hypothetical protein
MVLAPVLALLWLAGCGAGIAGGILASDDSSSSNPPQLRPIGAASGPLVPPSESVFGVPTDPRDVILRDLVVDNYVAPGGARIRVQLRALGATAEQAFPSAQSAGGNSTTIKFAYTTTAILTAMQTQRVDPTAADIVAQLVVLADDVEITEPHPFVLRRQPTVSLELPAGQSSPPALLSTLGTSRLKLRVKSLGEFQPRQLEEMLEMRVAVSSPEGGNVDIRIATQLKVTDTNDNSGDRFVEATPPPSTFPTQAAVFLSSSTTGRSTFESDVYYRPYVGLVVPRAGSLDGGTLVTLTGKGLVPLDFTDPIVPKLDFSRVDLRVRKGERLMTIPEAFLRRDLSTGDSLTFTMPPSPDGLPGPADVLVEVALPTGVRLKAQPAGVFSYGDAAVSFGPRGAVLRGKPLAVDMGVLVTLGAEPEDLIALYSNAGRPQLQLYGALDNGLFTRLGAPFAGGDPQNTMHMGPVDVCVGDLDRDGRNDVFILNAGSGSVAEHTMLLGTGPPDVYLLPPPTQVAGTPEPRQCLAGDINGNGTSDVLVLSDGSVEPTMLLSPQEPMQGQPSFTPNALTSGPTLLDAALIRDLNGDGHNDIVLVEGLVTSGTPPKDTLRLLYFAGPDPGPKPDQELLVVVPGYKPSNKSRVVGVHAVGDGQLKHLALVLEGIRNDAATPPTITVVRNNKSGYQQPTAKDTIHFASTEPGVCCSTDGDLDGDKVAELVVAQGVGSTTPLWLFRWSLDRLVEVTNGVDTGTEPMTAISELRIGTAVGPGTPPNEPARSALFVVHEGGVDGVVEPRITTLIAAPGPPPKLISPDGYLEVKAPIKHLTLGEFKLPRRASAGQSLDVCVATTDSLRLVANDGIGVLALDKQTAVSGLVPSTVTTVRQYRSTEGLDSVAFLTFGSTNGCRLGFLDPSSNAAVFGTVDLRRFAPPAISGRAVDPASRILEGDVDGDGTDDIVVLLNLKEASKRGKDGDALILFLKGKANRAKGVFPVDMPDVPDGQGSPTHGNVTSIVMGDFASGQVTSGDLGPELAVAIPQGESQSSPDGNHVRFYNFTKADQQTKGARFEQSYVSSSFQVLVAGSQPRVMAAGDFDGNGTIDLTVAGGDQTNPRLRIFDNTMPSGTSSAGKVDIARFVERTSNPLPLAPGTPHCLIARDINGDLLLDLVAAIRDSGSTLRFSIGHYLNPSIVDAVRGQILPPSRTGTLIQRGSAKVPRNANLTMAVGDMNGDGRPDIVIGWDGWDSAAAVDLNLRVLFGNN